MIDRTNSYVPDNYFYMCLPGNSHWYLCDTHPGKCQGLYVMYKSDINPQYKTVHFNNQTKFLKPINSSNNYIVKLL